MNSVTEKIMKHKFPMFEIDGLPIGPLNECFVIAEVGQAHEGSLGAAHQFIEAAKSCGADAVKFQTHIAEEESTYDEPFRVKFSSQDKTRFEYWKRMEFSDGAWKELFDHAKEAGLTFLSSAFSVKAVELLENIGVPAWKVGSGEINSTPLLDVMLETKKPILLSSGLANIREIEERVDYIQSSNVPLALFQCTTKYPTSFKDVGLNNMTEFMKQFDVPVGLSDHSGSIFLVFLQFH